MASTCFVPGVMTFFPKFPEHLFQMQMKIRTTRNRIPLEVTPFRFDRSVFKKTKRILSMEFLPRGCNVLAKCFATTTRHIDVDEKNKTNANIPTASPKQFYVD